MRLSIFPRNTLFYDHFEELAQLMVRGSEGLCDLLEHFENIDLKAAHLKEIEHEADNITHALYRLVNQTFVTPMDREDIVALAQRMDDVIDFVEAAGTTIRIYDVTHATVAARGLADLCRLQCLQLQKAIAELRRKGLKAIPEYVKEVNRYENEADTLYLRAMAELFQGEMSTIEIIKWREVYVLLEDSTDSCEDVAHVLESIVLKNA